MNAWPWLETLGRASLEGGLLILVVWWVTRAWSGLPAWARGSLWWMASARLLIGLLPLTQLEVRTPTLPVTAVWWPAAVAETAPPSVEPVAKSAHALLGEPITSSPEQKTVAIVPPVTPPPSRPWDPALLTLGLAAIWLAGAGIRLIGLVRQGMRVRRMVRASRPLEGPLCEALAPGAITRFALSGEAPVPMVTGLLRPVILLPEKMLRGSADDLRLAVAHELAHVRRADLWFAWVPALAETVFWFHPLVGRCVREYVECCEEACDRDALRVTGASPYDYGRLLVAFGVHRRLAAATAMPCGSPSPSQLQRRLAQLRQFAPLAPRLRNAALTLTAAFALVGLVPLRVVPTSAAPAVAAATGGDVATPATSMSAVADDADDNDDAEWDAWDDWTPPTPPAPPAAPAKPARPATPATPAEPAVPAAPATPATPADPSKSWYWGSRYASRSGDERSDPDAYVYYDRDDQNYNGSGDQDDWSDAKQAGRKLNGDYFWMRADDRQYLIEDAAFLARIHQAFAPQRAIGERQSKIGEVQSFVGERQSQIGEQQSKIGEKQSEIGERQSELASVMARRGNRSEFERLSADLAEQMEMLGREQEKLSRQMEPLSRRQEELGAQMEVLGREMERASKQAQRELRSLVQEAVRTGKAKPIL